MDRFNLTGLIFVVVLLIPNIIYAATNKDGFAGEFHNKLVETGEQIGRFGCFILMFIQPSFVTLGYIYMTVRRHCTLYSALFCLRSTAAAG